MPSKIATRGMKENKSKKTNMNEENCWVGVEFFGSRMDEGLRRRRWYEGTTRSRSGRWHEAKSQRLTI